MPVRQGLLLELGQDHAGPAPARAELLALQWVPRSRHSRAESPVAVGVLGEGQTDLLEVVLAGAPRLLAGRLDGRQEQGDQHPDDRDDDQELDQGEAEGT